MHYRAITGPHGKGALPVGQYEVGTRHAVVGSSLSSSFEDTVSKNRWFIPIKPQFFTHRDGFGIHPDGNIEGTKGCIGLTSSYANSFWVRWKLEPLPIRPIKLYVTE